MNFDHDNYNMYTYTYLNCDFKSGTDILSMVKRLKDMSKNYTKYFKTVIQRKFSSQIIIYLYCSRKIDYDSYYKVSEAFSIIISNLEEFDIFVDNRKFIF